MKELTSNHDDLDKRLAIFFGLGAFIMSALVGLVRGYTLEGFLLQGVLVLILATLGGWAFGVWLRSTLAATAPAEAAAENVERRTSVPVAFEDRSVVVAPQSMEQVVSDEVHEPLTGSTVNFTLPELNPADEAALQAIAAGAGAALDGTPEPAPAKA